MTYLRDFRYYGFRLRTDLPLTGLPRWPGDARPADIELLQGEVPDRLEAPVWSNRQMAMAGDGTVLMTLRDVGRVIVQRGAAARIALAGPNVSMIEIEGSLLAVVAGVLLHQRGVVPLHASSVVMRERVVAFAGRSGLGKSTIAAALVCAGHRLLSDDITAIRFATDGMPFAVPGSQHLRLSDDAAQLAGVPSAALVPGRVRDGKRIWRRPADETECLPLAVIIRLEIDPSCAEPVLERLVGSRAIVPMEDLLYRAPLGERLGRALSLAEDMVRIANAIPIYRLVRPAITSPPPAIIDLLRSALF